MGMVAGLCSGCVVAGQPSEDTDGGPDSTDTSGTQSQPTGTTGDTGGTGNDGSDGDESTDGGEATGESGGSETSEDGDTGTATGSDTGSDGGDTGTGTEECQRLASVDVDANGSPVKTVLTLPGIAYVAPVAKGDFDGDGFTDLVDGTGQTDRNDRIIFGPLSTTSTVVHLPTVENAGSFSYAVADLDSDGSDELVGSFQFDPRDPSMSVHLFETSAEREVQMLPLPAMGVPDDGTGLLVRGGDVTGDGHPDIVVAGSAFVADGGPPFHLVVLVGDGMLGFQSVQRVSLDDPELPSSLVTVAMSVGDIDGTGGADVVTLGRPADDDGIEDNAFLVTYSAVNLIDGPVIVPTPLSMPFRNAGFADFDGDGLTDVMLPHMDLYFSASQGDGSFAEAEAVGSSNSPSSILMGDIDGRHGPDVLLAYGVGSLYILLQDAVGGLQDPIVVGDGLNPWYTPLIVDIDNDGDEEVVAEEEACL